VLHKAGDGAIALLHQYAYNGGFDLTAS